MGKIHFERVLFLFYLISHNRPINELLAPNLKDISSMYESEFKNMAVEEVGLSELVKVRKELVKKIMDSLNDNDKAFLKSFVENRPDWSLVKNSKLQNFPSVKWKLLNQQKMGEDKKRIYIKKVETLLS